MIVGIIVAITVIVVLLFPAKGSLHSLTSISPIRTRFHCADLGIGQGQV